MDHHLCHRCVNYNRPVARFCANCGCPLPDSLPTPQAPAKTSGGTMISLLLLGTLAVAMLGPRGAHNHAMVDSAAGPRVTGLIIDLPPDYPAEFFTRYAFPVE